MPAENVISFNLSNGSVVALKRPPAIYVSRATDTFFQPAVTMLELLVRSIGEGNRGPR